MKELSGGVHKIDTPTHNSYVEGSAIITDEGLGRVLETEDQDNC